MPRSANRRPSSAVSRRSMNGGDEVSRWECFRYSRWERGAKVARLGEMGTPGYPRSIQIYAASGRMDARSVEKMQSPKWRRKSAGTVLGAGAAPRPAMTEARHVAVAQTRLVARQDHQSAKAATACPAAANPAPAAADTSRCQPREAALFNPRTRSNPLSLAARRGPRCRDAVLRRRPDTGA